MPDRLDVYSDQTDKADLPIESEREPSVTTSEKDYLLLLLVVLIKLGDSIEVYLPGVITQQASCELCVSDFQEGLLAVIFYIFFAIAILMACPVSTRLGERMTMILSLYMSIVFAILCAIVPNYYTLILSRALTGMCVGLNGCTSGVFFAKFASSKEVVTKGSFLFEALTFPVGGTWVSILGWLFLDVVGWRVFVLLTSIPLFIPPLIMLHCCFKDQEQHGDLKIDEGSTSGETDKLVKSGNVPNFAARVTRSSLFMFSNLCIGYSTIILAPWIIRIYKIDQGAQDDVIFEKCEEVVQDTDFLILAVVIGVSNIIGRLLGIFLWDRVKFLFFQSSVTVVVALSFGILLLKPSFLVSMVFLGLSKFCYSMQGAEIAVLHYDYDYFGKLKFELGSYLSSASSVVGAVVGTSLSAFLDPYIALIVLLLIACSEVVLICFMRERF